VRLFAARAARVLGVVGAGVELGAALEIDAPRAPLFPAEQGLGPAPIALGDLDVRPDRAGERGVKAQLVDDPGGDALGPRASRG
jgi:hypothetical protein